MTLKALLKNAGVPKIPLLEKKIDMWAFEHYKWAIDERNDAWVKFDELGKLNTSLQDQHKADLERIQKLEDQVKAAAVKQQFTDSQKEVLKQKIEDLELDLRVCERMVDIKTQRIENYDKWQSEFRAGKVGMSG